MSGPLVVSIPHRPGKDEALWTVCASKFFLPWLLGKLLGTIQPLIRKEETLLLEKNDKCPEMRSAWFYRYDAKGRRVVWFVEDIEPEED
jgi:hypothetical protein